MTHGGGRVRIALSADHAGLPMKPRISEWLHALGHEVDDFGAYELDPNDDYPDFTTPVARAVRDSNADRGIIVCGSGVGASVAANKVHGVRAAICHDTYSARQSVEHDDVNVLCLGARIIGDALAEEIVITFITARFTGEERHKRRLAKIRALEEGTTPTE